MFIIYGIISYIIKFNSFCCLSYVTSYYKK